MVGSGEVRVIVPCAAMLIVSQFGSASAWRRLIVNTLMKSSWIGVSTSQVFARAGAAVDSISAASTARHDSALEGTRSLVRQGKQVCVAAPGAAGRADD